MNDINIGDKVITSGYHLKGITWYKEYTVENIKDGRLYLINDNGDIAQFYHLLYTISPTFIRDRTINYILE